MAALKASDFAIRQQAIGELQWDTRVSAPEVGVQVGGGVVTLTGTVSSWAKRKAAEEAAHRVLGVIDVVNDLDVRVPGASQRTDADLARSVRSSLESDVTVPDKQIRSTVSQAVVILEGRVAHWSERADAEQAVERLTGVRQVINRIEVETAAELDRIAIRIAIQRALERHASREASRIEIGAADGTLHVVGVVHTRSERDAVLGAVRGTRGVGAVVDRLTVRLG